MQQSRRKSKLAAIMKYRMIVRFVGGRCYSSESLCTCGAEAETKSHGCFVFGDHFEVIFNVLVLVSSPIHTRPCIAWTLYTKLIVIFCSVTPFSILH